MRNLLLAAALLALAALPAADALAVHAKADVAVETPAVPALPSAPALPSPDAPALPELPALPESPTSLPPVRIGAGVDGEPLLAPASVRPTRESGLVHAVLPAAKTAAPPAIAAAGLLALLQALGAFRFVGAGAFALYSRLTKSNLLDNEHRDAVYKLIQAQPGLGVSEIASRSGLGWGTTVYHLDRLEREGFVASERGGLHKCYFAVGLVDRDARRAQAALKADTRRDVAQVLLARPGLTQTELCEALGMSASAASKQISKLESAGLVRREREWKTVRLFPQPALAGAPA